jgi:hypothetical protein
MGGSPRATNGTARATSGGMGVARLVLGSGTQDEGGVRVDRTTLFWRRTDAVGLERLELTVVGNGIVAAGTVLGVEDGGYRLEHRWRLTGDWRAVSLEVERWGCASHSRLVVERDGDGWRVDGVRRSDLDGAEEPDLSVTPFCNTLPIRRLPAAAGATSTLDTCYVDAGTMRVIRSRQRYTRLEPRRVHYLDLGTSAGFQADLDVDDEGLVTRYEHLFERVEPGPVSPR